MATFDRITQNPGLMNGQPCIRGMRLTVRRVLEILANYPGRDDIKKENPELEDEVIRQARENAATYLENDLEKGVVISVQEG